MSDHLSNTVRFILSLLCVLSLVYRAAHVGVSHGSLATVSHNESPYQIGGFRPDRRFIEVPAMLPPDIKKFSVDEQSPSLGALISPVPGFEGPPLARALHNSALQMR